MGWLFGKKQKSKNKLKNGNIKQQKKPRSQTFILEDIISPSGGFCPIPIDDSFVSTWLLDSFTQEELFAAILGNDLATDITNIDIEHLFQDYFEKVETYFIENPTAADSFDLEDLSTWPTLEALINPGLPSVEIPDVGGVVGTLPPPVTIPIDPPRNNYNKDYDFPVENQPLVGVIDTGFSGSNPDIDYSRITLGSDRLDNDNNPLLTSGEGNEHGTHVLGIIGATRDNSLGIDGINDNAPLWLGRAIGSGEWAESLVEFVDAARESGKKNGIANLSLDLTQIDSDGIITTRYELTPEERVALEYARQNGVLIVTAAGNDGGVMSVLGQASQEFDNIITVGAADGENRAVYSSYGNGLDILAPGGTESNPLLSTVGDGLGTMAGSSVASAQVSGAASLVWAANPDLSYRQVVEILKSTARDVQAPGWDEETGVGLLDIDGAVELAKVTVPQVYEVPSILTPQTWSGAGVVIPGERAVNFTHPIINENFSGWVMPTIGVALRNSNRHEDRSGLAEPHRKTLSFDAWTYGQRVSDYQLGTPDELWYRLSGTNYWVPSAYIYGFPGSTPSVLAPAIPTPAPTPTPSSNRYQVKAGDVPSVIAQRELGNASRWREIIRESTGRQLTDADALNLQIGEWLILPGGDTEDSGEIINLEGLQKLLYGNVPNVITATYGQVNCAIWGIVHPDCKHPGIDFAATGQYVYTNPPIYSPVDGVVTGIDPNHGLVYLYNEKTDTTFRFLHMNSWNVSNGQRVSKGQQIGTEGQRGYATGDHLHLDAWPGWHNSGYPHYSQSVNPINAVNLANVGSANPTPSPTPTNDYAPPGTPGQSRQYIVRPNDNLWDIAQRELGNGERWREIMKTPNGGTFTEAEAQQLQIGQSVYLPVSYQTGIGQPITPPPASNPQPSSRYQVKAGDTPSDIAQDLLGNASRWREIIRASTGRQLTDADARNLQIGEWLILPGGSNSPIPTPAPTPTPTPNPGFSIDALLASVPAHIRPYAQTSIPLILAESQAAGITDLGQIAYILATSEHESHSGRWMEELASGDDYEGRQDLGNTQPGDGRRFKGRGYVQITGRLNYTKWSNKLGIDLVGQPERASEPAIAAKIITQGMRDGSFTGVGLGDYINGSSRDFHNARRIVNYIDRAASIAQIAERYYAALVGGNFSPTPTPTPSSNRYQVQSGDVPSIIAQQQLGDASRWREIIRESTGRQLTDADAFNLQIGEWLILPGGSNSPAPTPTPSSNRYQVQSGDVPSIIAQRQLGDASRWREIIRESTGRQLTDADALNLQIGEWLILPGGSNSPAPTPIPTPTPTNEIFSIGTLEEVWGAGNSVNSSNTNDWYSFKIDKRSNLRASLTAFDANASLSILADEGKRKLTGINGSGSTNWILEPGDYKIQIKNTSGDTDYALNLNRVNLVGDIQNGDKYFSDGVKLHRYNTSGRTYEGGIEAGKDTIVVIHGRGSSSGAENIKNLLTKAADKYGTTHQILALDWQQPAKDESNPPFMAARASTPVAEWAQKTLTKLAVPSGKISLFGHSLGSYVSSEIGRLFGKVNSIVALDPAFPWKHYEVNGNESLKKFQEVAENSTAFVVSDEYTWVDWAGDTDAAASANDSFLVRFNGTEDNYEVAIEVAGELHGGVIEVFTSILEENPGGFTNYKTDSVTDDGIFRKYSLGRNVHEGVITANKENNEWKPDKFLYLPGSDSARWV